MRIVKHVLSLPVTNQDGYADVVHNRRHGPLFPSSLRAIICGPSGCGKTNALLSLLLHPNGMRFENIYVYSRTLTQNKYEKLKEIMEKTKCIGYYPYSDATEIIPPLQAKENSIFIFDDVPCDKQNTMREFFSMGRHKNLDCLFLIQSYAKTSKHLLRDNTNCLILFKQDGLNMRHIYEEHVNTDMTFEKFTQICRECWKQDFGFLVIVKEDELNNGRYRRAFDEFIVID